MSNLPGFAHIIESVYSYFGSYQFLMYLFFVALLLFTACLIVGIKSKSLRIAAGAARPKMESVLYDADFIEEGAYQKALKLLEDARLKSYSILSNSQSKAQRVLDKAHTFSDITRKNLQTELEALSKRQFASLEDISRQMMQVYKRMVEDERSRNVSVLAETSHTIEGEILKEVESYKSILKKDLFDSQKVVEQKIQTEYQDLKRDLDEYKKEKLKAIDESIYKLLVSVTKEFLSQALPVKGHEELVLKILEQEKDALKFKP